VLLAVLVTAWRALRLAIYPIVVASQAMPVIAIAPLLIIWFGYGPTSKILVAALVAFFPIVVSSAAGLASLNDGAVRLMQSFPASRNQVFLQARLPHASPQIFAGLKVAAVLSVVGAVVGEWVGSDEGLGFLIIQSNAKLATTTVFGAVVVLTLMGIVLFLIVTLIEWLALPWNRRPTKG
jgi:NitT/TauT family transport system permease protein